MNWQVRDHVSVVPTDYGSVILDEAQGQYWQLNSTGSLIAERLFHGDDLDTISRRLADEYSVEEEQATADIAALAAALHQVGLLQETSGR